MVTQHFLEKSKYHKYHTVRLGSNVSLHTGGPLLKMFPTEYFLAEHTVA